MTGRFCALTEVTVLPRCRREVPRSHAQSTPGQPALVSLLSNEPDEIVAAIEGILE